MHTHRHELTDQQWERLQPLLPPQKLPTGRPAADHRRILHGILWLLRTGAPWRDVPERSGAWQTVASRFYRWCTAGLWDRLLAVGQQQADAAGQLDGARHCVDGTIVRAHQHAAGAKKGGRTPGQRHAATACEPLLASGAVKRLSGGRPKRRPGRVAGDTAYSSRKIRRYLRPHWSRITRPRQQNEHRAGPFDRAIYRLRDAWSA